ELLHVQADLQKLCIGQEHRPAANSVRPCVLALPRGSRGHDRVTLDLLRDLRGHLLEVIQIGIFVAFPGMPLRQVTAMETRLRILRSRRHCLQTKLEFHNSPFTPRVHRLGSTAFPLTFPSPWR